MTPRSGVVTLIVAVVALAACDSATTVDSSTMTTNSATSTTVEEDGGPFDFDARTLAGESIRGESLKGRDVVLWFWAPWCPICLVEGKEEVAPALAEWPDDVEFIGIAGRSDDLDEMEEFLEWTGTGSVTHIVDLDGSIWEGFGVALQPALYFVNQDGTARRAGSGLTTEDILAEVEALTTR